MKWAWINIILFILSKRKRHKKALLPRQTDKMVQIYEKFDKKLFFSPDPTLIIHSHSNRCLFVLHIIRAIASSNFEYSYPFGTKYLWFKSFSFISSSTFNLSRYYSIILKCSRANSVEVSLLLLPNKIDYRHEQNARQNELCKHLIVEFYCIRTVEKSRQSVKRPHTKKRQIIWHWTKWGKHCLCAFWMAE